MRGERFVKLRGGPPCPDKDICPAIWGDTDTGDAYVQAKKDVAEGMLDRADLPSDEGLLRIPAELVPELLPHVADALTEEAPPWRNST